MPPAEERNKDVYGEADPQTAKTDDDPAGDVEPLRGMSGGGRRRERYEAQPSRSHKPNPPDKQQRSQGEPHIVAVGADVSR